MFPALTTLELQRVVELISLEAKTAPGKSALAARKPATRLDVAERQQAELAEMNRFVLSQGLIPLAGLINVRDLLHGEAALELEDSWHLLRAARATQALRETFLRVDTYPRLHTIAERIDDLSELVSAVGRFFTREGKLREEASAELRSLRTKINAKRSAIQRTLNDLMNRKADAIQEPIVTLRGDRYVIPVRADHRNDVPGILHERSGSGASFFIEPMGIVELNNDLADLLIQEREEIARITRFVAQQFAASAEALEHAVEEAGELDAIQACALAFQQMQAARPLFSTDGTLRLIDARHPLLDERLAAVRETAFGERDGSTRVIPTTLTIDSNQPALVISGPNAGGKTVALKTAGLLTAMALCGFPVPAADGTTIPLVDKIHVLIGDDQNVMEHLSTFSAYLMRLKSILKSVTEKSLVLLDELGSGTDPDEGAALAASVIEHLLERKCLFIATTHLSAVKTFAVTDPRIVNASMEFDAATGAPTFRMILGVPGRSRAIDTAERIGLPTPIIEAARARLGERYGDMDRLLSELQKTMAAILTEREELRGSLAEASARSEEMKKKVDELERERKKIAEQYRKALDEAETEVRSKLQSELKRLRDQDRTEREKLKIEQVVQTVVEPLASRSATPEPNRREIRVGDRVEHRRFKQKGEVTALDGKKATLSIGGKKMQVDTGDLTLLEGPQAPVKLAPQRETSNDVAEAPVGAELNLIGQRVDDALEESDKFLDRSLLDGKQAVRLIHGYGTGTLRKAIREHLRKHPAVRSFRPGNDNEGGDGATIAVLDV